MPKNTIEIREINAMITFVNRQSETTLIDDAFKALQNYNNDGLLRTPIIDFFGVEGIGKTAILRYIQEQCSIQQIRYILIDTSQGGDHFSQELVRQVMDQYNIQLPSLEENENLSQQSMRSTRALLDQGTAVMILDNVDATNEELLARITSILRDVIDEKKLFVVLASKRGVHFNSERAISRKLTSLQLKPLDRKSCDYYLDVIDPPLKLEARKYVFAWTRGYPLAMEVMITAINEQNLNPVLLEDQKALINIIVERVIDQKVFASLETSERHRYKELLMLLSIPRQFNLLIMQELIEKSANGEERRSSLAYMGLPKYLMEKTNVLSWNIFKGGFTIDMPIRNIFLLKMRLEQPELYSDLHQFLADLNQKLADEVNDANRIQYLCEYLYHSAYVQDEHAFIQSIELVQQKITKITFEALEVFESFEASFAGLLQDNDFMDVLGARMVKVSSLLYRYLAAMNKREAHITVGEKHTYHLRKFLFYISKEPDIADLRATWTSSLRNIIIEEPSGSIIQLVDELHRSETLEEALRDHLAELAELVVELSLGE